jgi:hypothetical protein
MSSQPIESPPKTFYASLILLCPTFNKCKDRQKLHVYASLSCVIISLHMTPVFSAHLNRKCSRSVLAIKKMVEQIGGRQRDVHDFCFSLFLISYNCIGLPFWRRLIEPTL